MVEVPDAAAMEALGARLAAACEPGLVIFLCGALGAGKTTLTRGLLRALGHGGSVKSPTYTLVEPYDLPAMSLYHFDFYRLSDPEELEFMGVRDYFGRHALCIVEWPERAANRLPRPDLDVTIEYLQSGRRVALNAVTPAGVRLLARISAHNNL
ncbi:MAG: tRNA (adenosine(37)-N6)-threonylcarbamoyltransferase complex ATPase subunit type 1 TsaE [Gammaproteobacteria bacterium]